MAAGSRRRRGRLLALGALALAVALVPVVGVRTVPAGAVVSGDLQVTGHGYGHGRGLGQWGAYGYAVNAGWSWQQIVAHYYGGTTLATHDNTPITVQLTAQDGKDLTVTSGASFTVGGIPVAAGSAARIHALSASSFQVATSTGCGQPEVWQTTTSSSAVVSDVPAPSSVAQMLSVCGSSGTKQYRGSLSVVSTSSGQRTVNAVAMEDYLRGVVPRESPASWGSAGGGKGAQALAAQAVAARSYAYAEARTTWAQTCDTPSCQVYGGAGTNGTAIEDPRTDAAVSATANQVLVSSGRVVRAEFSSSTGGYTAGGQFPAVPDDGDTASPYNDWAASFPAQTVGAAFGVGQLVDFRITQTNGLGEDGGRVLQVVVQGTAGTVTRTGDDVRIALGLKSNWFRVTAAVQQQPVIYQGSADAAGATAVALGSSGDVPLSCDWNGDGIDTPGIFRAGTWYLTNTPGSSAVDVTFAFGQRGDQPVCGDWDGNGTDTPGVYRSGVVYLRNSNTTGRADGSFPFGGPGDTLVAGDWDGDTFDTVGVWRRGVFYLANSNLAPRANAVVTYGAGTDRPTVGDWDGDGVDTVGVYRAGTFYLRNRNTTGAADVTVPFGNDGDQPLVGRRQAGTGDTVGVARYY